MVSQAELPFGEPQEADRLRDDDDVVLLIVALLKIAPVPREGGKKNSGKGTP